MGEIRSSWEIAQEKASKLGDLSTEEKKQRREATYGNTALTVIKGYIDRPNIRYIEKELQKYTGDDRELMRQMLLDRLLETIDLNNELSIAPVFAGISVLYMGTRVKECLDDISVLYKEYRNAGEKERHRIEDDGRKMLREKGISGSAVRVADVDSGTGHTDTLNTISASFREKLGVIAKKIRNQK